PGVRPFPLYTHAPPARADALPWGGDRSARFQRRVLAILGPGVVRARAGDLAVLALFDHMGTPAGGPRNHEQRSEHRRRDPHHVVRTGAVPVQVREHLLGVHHQVLDALGHIEQDLVAALATQAAADLLDDGVARVAHGVDRMAEADDDLLALHARTDVRLGLVGAGVAADDVHRHFVRAAVLGSTQGADGPGDAREQVRAGAG